MSWDGAPAPPGPTRLLPSPSHPPLQAPLFCGGAPFPPRVRALCWPAIVSTKTSKSAKPSTGDKPSPEGAKPQAPSKGTSPGEKAGLLRKNGPLIAAFLGVAAVGIIIGRASSAPHETPPVPTARPSASSAFDTEPQQFDLSEIANSKAGIPLRPMDRDIIEAIQNASFDRARMNDLFPDRPYRVRLVGSLAERRIGLVMIDLNRDGKFDERWDLTRTEISRVVHDDSATAGAPVKYTLGHGRWQVH